MNKLVITVLGHENSGKSTTWKELFGKENIRTGKNIRKLYLDTEKVKSVDVFLINGSPEEMGKYVGDIIGDVEPQIVLCSVQYLDKIKTTTFKYFIDNNFHLYCQWLNPGFKDKKEYEDYHKIEEFLNNSKADFFIRNGKDNPKSRVDEIRDYIINWGNKNGLI